jgi:hypothetical protein
MVCTDLEEQVNLIKGYQNIYKSEWCVKVAGNQSRLRFLAKAGVNRLGVAPLASGLSP